MYAHFYQYAKLCSQYFPAATVQQAQEAKILRVQQM